jgi:hypothetical protein
MRASLTRIRSRLNYATVVSGLTAFVVLCGGAAFAANQLGKNSVGKKQLKANAVTTAKIKKNAVTAAKIRAGAVDGAKVADGSLGGTEFQLSGAPYTRIAQELRTSVNVQTPGGAEPFVVVPVPGLSYTQEAGRTDVYVGAVDVTFTSGCTAPRGAVAYLLMDPPPTLKLNPPDPTIVLYVAAAGTLEDTGSGAVTRRINLASFSAFGTRVGTAAPQSHTFSLLLAAGCKAGEGVSAGNVALDVIGTN